MNPALELIKIFENWNYLGQDNELYVQIRETEGHKALDLLGKTITLINLCEKRGMYVEGFKESTIEWAEACISPFRANGFGPITIDKQTIRSLQFCASMISQLFLPIADPVFQKKREAYEEEIRTLVDTVEDDETLNPDLRSHMRALLDHLLECLATLETTGQFYIQDAFQKLSVYIDAARFQTRNDEAKMVYDSIANLLRDISIGVASSLLASRILPAISAG